MNTNVLYYGDNLEVLRGHIPIQIITVEEMLNGKRPELPSPRSPYAQAPREREPAQQARF